MTPLSEGNARFRGDDQELLKRAATWSGCPTLGDCSTAKLNELARVHGLDFATALLYERLLRVPKHGAFFERVHAGDEVNIPGPPPHVLIVPGAFYREHKNTGADGSRIVPLVKELGGPVERIPLRSFGALADNARVIADCLTAHRGRPVVLLTLSKGSADLKIALSRPDAAEVFRDVIAWVSLSGLLQGTPLVQWLRRRPLRWLGVHLLLWLRGQRYAVLEELRHEDDGPLNRWPELPPHLRVIHIVGFPLRRHLSHPFAPRAYERLAPLGPNDG
ncbi:MAG TPA: hypothetical protein VFR76_06975, partial [Verrucomicrobiae bacterium]|nr:hypothetical protein [Verrucomicrobiae bacterium]